MGEEEHETDGRAVSRTHTAMVPAEEDRKERPGEAFGELVRYTATGYLGGLLLGVALDSVGLSRSGVGQWLVRTLAGEGESLLEGAFAIRRRVSGTVGSMAEAYGWGKLGGMALPWVIDAGSRAAGIDVYSPQGFFIPFFYAMSDQIGAAFAGFLFLRGDTRTVGRTARAWVQNPVMRASMTVILLVPLGLLAARLLGFSPSTQVRTAFETIAANLCWVPPLVGWLHERRQRRRPQ